MLGSLFKTMEQRKPKEPCCLWRLSCLKTLVHNYHRRFANFKPRPSFFVFINKMNTAATTTGFQKGFRNFEVLQNTFIFYLWLTYVLRFITNAIRRPITTKNFFLIRIGKKATMQGTNYVCSKKNYAFFQMYWIKPYTWR